MSILQRHWLPACAGITLLTASCSGPAIKHQVLTPPPSSPRTEFVLEKPEVQSRETGEEAWQRNEQLSEQMTQALSDSLAERGMVLAVPGADAIRARIYLGHGDASARTPGRRRPLSYIEVRLELLAAGSKTVRYSTHTRTQITASPFGLGPDAEEIIQNTLRQSAQDFVSRL